MRQVYSPLLILAAGCLLSFFSMATLHIRSEEPTEVSSRHRFADFGFMPPSSDYDGRVFNLRQDYPHDPPSEEAIPEFCRNEFAQVKSDWKKFMQDVRAYCFAANIYGGDVESDFDIKGANQHWYHMPWQHWGPSGREGIHGLTKEAPVLPRQLAWTQTYTGGQTYAVAFYNEFGGHTIWQVWKDPDNPQKGINKIAFPGGTVIFKLLFTDVPVKQVPFLDPPLQWQAYITKDFASTDRSIRKVSLIQMDIMVRHKHAPLGWVFGTYQYNGKMNRKNLWENLIPVGLQWGNDPENADNSSNPQPVATVINPRLQETVINPDAKELPPTHLGWNGRLNGPVDNPMSSCISCHMTAETPQRSEISPLFEKNPPEPGSKEWMRWFQNLGCGERFDKHSMSTDSSLQLAISLQNYRAWYNQKWKMRASQYRTNKELAEIVEEKSKMAHPLMTTDADSPEVEIRRSYPPN